MIIHECIEIFAKNIVSFPLFLSIINHMFLFTTFFLYIDWMFFFIFIAKKTNAEVIFLSDFVNVSNFDRKFYVFKIKSFCKIFIIFCDSSWIMVYKTYVSDQTPFKAFIIVNILKINQSFSGGLII